MDPDLTLLCELTEDKGRDLWVNQLRDAPTIAPRLAAAVHLGREKRPDDCETLGISVRPDGARVIAVGKPAGPAQGPLVTAADHDRQRRLDR